MTHIVPIGQQDNLIALAATIRTAHAGATLAATNVIKHALAAGDALIAAKAAVRHGNCPVTDGVFSRREQLERGGQPLRRQSRQDVARVTPTPTAQLAPPRTQRGHYDRA